MESDSVYSFISAISLPKINTLALMPCSLFAVASLEKIIRHVVSTLPPYFVQVRAGGEDAESAVHENQLDIVRLLVSHGADLNITDESGIAMYMHVYYYIHVYRCTS